MATDDDDDDDGDDDDDDDDDADDDHDDLIWPMARYRSANPSLDHDTSLLLKSLFWVESYMLTSCRH